MVRNELVRTQITVKAMKPPQYEEMDHGREVTIPLAFEKVCGRLNRYRLRTNPPIKPLPNWVGPIPRPTFEVLEEGDGSLVAEFYPNGHYRCHRDDFLPYFKKMEAIIEKAGQDAYDRFIEKYEEMRES
jgi:hypothetical protein